MKTSLLALALAAALVAGCSDSGSSPTVVTADLGSPATTATRGTGPTGTTGTGAGEELSEDELAQLLLTLADVPTGWEDETSSDPSGADGPACFRVIDDEVGDHPSAEVAFAAPADLPALFQKVVDLGDDAVEDLEAVSDGLEACTDITMEAQGRSIPGSIQPLSFPAFGDDGAAYEMTFSDGTRTAVFDLVVVRVGRLGMLFGYVDEDRTDVAQLEGFVEAAVDKVEASGVTDAAPRP